LLSTSDDDNVTQNYFLPVKAIQRAEVTRTAAFFEHIRQLWSCTTTKGHRIRRRFFFFWRRVSVLPTRLATKTRMIVAAHRFIVRCVNRSVSSRCSLQSCWLKMQDWNQTEAPVKKAWSNAAYSSLHPAKCLSSLRLLHQWQQLHNKTTH